MRSPRAMDQDKHDPAVNRENVNASRFNLAKLSEALGSLERARDLVAHG